MDLDFPYSDDIDSLCHVRESEPGTPEAIAPRCKQVAVTWFSKVDGTRVYVCRDHALDPFRFPAAGLSRADLPDDYNELRTLAAEQGIRLESPGREELEDRLLSPPDPEEFENAPAVVRCSTCGKLTLSEDVTVVEGTCPACDEEVQELDPTDYAITTPPEG
jgi:phage FluMu protein Com